MFVSIIFDAEYFGMGERYKWFLKNISHARENDCLVITHKYIEEHYEEYAKNCESRFYDEFEMRRLGKEEYQDVSKGFIRDEFFDDLEESLVSRSEMFLFLLQNRYPRLEMELVRIIEDELAKRKETKVEAIFNCLDTFASVAYLGEKYQCPIISYCFSAVKKIHGYTQTLYVAAIDGAIRQSEEAEKRYMTYKSGKQVPIVFSNRELLAIFGKKKNIPLLKIMECEPEHELGICKMACSIYPYDYSKYKYTDTDLYYEARKKLKTTDIIIRDHPGIPWNGNDKGPKKEHERNDPISFILSCKRVTSIDSQILLKALLWNRTTFLRGNLSSLQFMCTQDICSVEKVDIHKLNYYMFGYLIPSALMFDADYWRWRFKQKPSEYDIYMKHFNYYMDYFGYDKEMFFRMDEENRFSYVLKMRHIDKRMIQDLLTGDIDFPINYEVLYSKIVLKAAEDISEEITCVNEQSGGIIRSRFKFKNEITIKQLIYYPFVDVGGFADIKSIRIDDVKSSRNENVRYIEKGNGGIDMEVREIAPGDHEISIDWGYFFQ